jgi:hypothetical protein
VDADPYAVSLHFELDRPAADRDEARYASDRDAREILEHGIGYAGDATCRVELGVTKHARHDRLEVHGGAAAAWPGTANAVHDLCEHPLRDPDTVLSERAHIRPQLLHVAKRRPTVRAPRLVLAIAGGSASATWSTSRPSKAPHGNRASYSVALMALAA